MSKAKISVSMKEESIAFIHQYQSENGVSNRSEVVEIAIDLLREKKLEQEYAEANKEIDYELDNWSGDGLEDESW